MAQNGMFRTALFGGYNREDVEEHIRNMEHEIETVKLLHQKEKQDLIRRAEESEGELALVKSELEEAHKQLDDAQPDDKSAQGLEKKPTAEKSEPEAVNAESAGAKEKEALNKRQDREREENSGPLAGSSGETGAGESAAEKAAGEPG